MYLRVVSGAKTVVLDGQGIVHGSKITSAHRMFSISFIPLTSWHVSNGFIGLILLADASRPIFNKSVLIVMWILKNEGMSGVP